jgi:death on curing protein
MTWEWVGLETVLAVHDQLIADHGGLPGVRDMGLVESAIAAPQSLAAYENPDVYDLAAAYGYGLARNHGFMDANKRTAYVVTRLFLILNGSDMTSRPEERVLVFEALGKGTVSREELAKWLRG